MEYWEMVEQLVDEWDLYEEDAEDTVDRAIEDGVSTSYQLDTWMYVNDGER